MTPLEAGRPEVTVALPCSGGRLSNGVEGYITKPCKVSIVNNFTFRIILTEGKKHQIRRMCSNLFQEVADLKRERIMNIKLGNLKPNSSREIKGEELDVFLSSTLQSQ